MLKLNRPYKLLKKGVDKLNGVPLSEDLAVDAGFASARDIFNVVLKMRFPKREKLNGKEIFPMEGTLMEKEYGVVKDLVEYDIKRGQYITQKPALVIKRLFNAKLLKEDRYSALKYVISVSAGNMEHAEQTTFLWRTMINLYNDENVKLLRKAKYVGSYEDFSERIKNNHKLSMDDMVEQISDAPPIWKSIFEDKEGKRYVLLVGGYGVHKDNLFSGLAVFWDDSILQENAGKVLNAFQLGSIDQSLFTGTGRIVEEDSHDASLLWYILEYTKFSMVQDKYIHKYIVMAGLDTERGMALPLVRGEFKSYNDAKSFIINEVVPQYQEAKGEYQKLIERVSKELDKKKEMEKSMNKEISVGGMYG